VTEAVPRALPAPAGAQIHWLEGDAMALASRDGAFDLVLCQHGLPFVPDRARAVREMRRVLAPGGRALVIVLQALARHPVFDALVESVSRHLAQPTSTVAAASA
jgi:ubiquinone/menaquinone biosynthesis C-methylase UbiE